MEPLTETLQSQLKKAGKPLLSSEALERLNKLGLASPLYAQTLRNDPAIALWLELQSNKDAVFRYSALASIWQSNFLATDAPEEETFNTLRKFRRLISLRIAYREVNGLSSVETSMQEHSLLADFCLQTTASILDAKYKVRFGTPWLNRGNRPCPYVVLALGKLGGMELNFCSDIDLIYIYENEGICLKNGQQTALTNQDYFQRFFQELTTILQKKTADGFLFNVDLRLRPEGETSSIAKTLPFTENYYWSRGQTWERMALIKARPCGGSIALGEELIETLNAYRYPRFIQPHIIEEVTHLKMRTELETLGDKKRKTDIKSGWGGIREIEYITQTLQLLNGGKNPFIQSNKTLEALERLHRYKILPKEDVKTLQKSYLFLRSVENLLQMREEKQTHTLPDTKKEQQALADQLNKADFQAFLEVLDKHRSAVNNLYKKILPQDSNQDLHTAWRAYLQESIIPRDLESRLEKYTPKPKALFTAFKKLVLGSNPYQVTEEQIRLAIQLSEYWEEGFPLLACPTTALDRLSKLAEKYGARMAFVKTCASTPKLFKTLCILLDRSSFITEILTQHPEILEELLNIRAEQIKSEKQLLREILALPQNKEFPRSLWLYVKAEQVRAAMCHALGTWSITQVQKHLSALAKATLKHCLQRANLSEDITLIGLGKLGSEELTYGSDLDLILLSAHSDTSRQNLREFTKELEYSESSYPTYTLDLRLRPYGNDGPISSTLDALQNYYHHHAQPWEIQALTRATVVAGNTKLAHAFESLKSSLLYTHPASSDILESSWEMRDRIKKHKTNPYHPERSFKATDGGLIDSEFLSQCIQLAWGYHYPELRTSSTRNVLEQALHLKLLQEKELNETLHNFDALRAIELALRQDTGKPETYIPEEKDNQLAHWINLPEGKLFLDYYLNILAQNQKAINSLKQELISLTSD